MGLLDLLIFDGGDFTGAVAALASFEELAAGVVDELTEELTGDGVVLAVAVVMTIVVLGFQHYALSDYLGQQKTVQKITVHENMFI